jgi:hypothetical protein
MPRAWEKVDFPVSQIRRYQEPGPIVLVTSALGDRRNIMTMGWLMVMEFTPSLVGCVIAGGGNGLAHFRGISGTVFQAYRRPWICPPPGGSEISPP